MVALYRNGVAIMLMLGITNSSNAQTIYDIDAYDGQTITTCDAKFTDSHPGSTHYAHNGDHTITFCSGDESKVLRFDFGHTSTYTNERIHPSDTLYIYNGVSTSDPLIASITGNSLNSNKLSFFGETSDFDFVSPNSCITFKFVSDASNNEDGWEAIISCVDKLECNSNPDLSDIFGSAPLVCNFNGYCGSTSLAHGAEFPTGLTGGGSCPTLFGGTIENNSWLKFEAASETVDFEFTVTSCSSGEGIQVAVFDYNGSIFTRKSDCALSDGVHNGTFTVSASNLTIGQTYYIMVDGNAGAICDYMINSSQSSSLNSLSGGADQTICLGHSVELIASGPSGTSNYNWTWFDGLGGSNNSQTLNDTPQLSTHYILSVSGDCSYYQDTVLVEVLDCSLPIELIAFQSYLSKIENYTVICEWLSTNEVNNSHFLIESSTDGINYKLESTVQADHSNDNIKTYQTKFKIKDRKNLIIRLTQVDLNSEQTILKEVALNISVPLEILQSSQKAIQINNIDKEFNEVEIFDLRGNKIYHTHISDENISIQTNNFPRVCVIKISGTHSSEIYKLIVE